ncbi:MAG: response regulator [Bacteroidia bacterium]|nr:response regulator [Bacteroidia bacterium]MCF8425863.1 response regulator [Bacteroidia bacterium]MCF8445642.1 response regulator [Bacteroidia bacterium]
MEIQKKVLLIDDDPINNYVNKRLITRLFSVVEIVEFLDAVSALEYLKENTPEIIFLDINMPEMDGWQFLENYRTYTNRTKVVILTSSIDPSDRLRSEQFDFVEGFFVKPLNISNTNEALSKV